MKGNLLKWLAGIIATLLCAGVVTALQSIATHDRTLAAVEERIRAIDRRIDDFVKPGERFSQQEADQMERELRAEIDKVCDNCLRRSRARD